MIRQLAPGMLHGLSGGKIEWEMLPIGPAGGGSSVEMDWATWIPRAYDAKESPLCAFINFEATVRDIESDEEYVAEKVLQLSRLIEAPGGIRAAVERIKVIARYAGFDSLPSNPVAYLLFVSNRSTRLPSEASLRSLLKGMKGSLQGSHPQIECSSIPTKPGALSVTTQSGSRIRVGLIGAEKLLELVYLAQALDKAKRHSLVNERFLFDLTDLAGDPILLDPMPHTVPVVGLSQGADLRIDGRKATLHRFTVDPFQFLRMSTVLRLVSDYSYLQRLPDGERLLDMAYAIQTGDRFPTPILCIPPNTDVIEERQKLIRHAGGRMVSPYQWHIIDGQHRVFCYYMIDPGVGVQEIDVNSYEIAIPADQASIASSLFLDVNFKAERPSEDLGLAYYAFSSQWPQGTWIPKRKRGRNRVGSKDFYSSRILASRFLLELSRRDTVYREFFKARGAKDPGKISIKSLSTYLATDFDMQAPDNPENPMSVKYGTLPGAASVWIVPHPAPGMLDGFWERLTAAFDEFSTRVSEGAGQGPVTNERLLQELVRKNNNVFVALWKTFYWYSLEQSPGATVPDIPVRNAAKIMRWLMREDGLGHLTGRTNRYKSGSGAQSLPSRVRRLIGGP